jgi:hypothetical protein
MNAQQGVVKVASHKIAQQGAQSVVTFKCRQVKATLEVGLL